MSTESQRNEACRAGSDFMGLVTEHAMKPVSREVIRKHFEYDRQLGSTFIRAGIPLPDASPLRDGYLRFGNSKVEYRRLPGKVERYQIEPIEEIWSQLISRIQAADGWILSDELPRRVGATLIVFGSFELELTPQLAELLELALREGGLPFDEARTHFSWESQLDDNIRATITKLRNAVSRATKKLPFTISVCGKEKRITARIASKTGTTK